MQKTAFIFPGQGSQYVGMGSRIREAYPEARALYDEASALAGFDVAAVSSDGPAGPLDEDVTAQVCVYTANEAHRAALARLGMTPDVVTGYSLGFYNALVAAGCISFPAGLKAVMAAGRLAKESSARMPGTMGAVIGLSLDEVEGVCREASGAGPVWVSNVNAARQVLVSGSVPGVEAAVSGALASGALHAYRLNMGAAYHSPMMEGAARGFSGFVAGLLVSAPSLPLLSYLDASYLADEAAVRDTVSWQIARRVLWKDTVQRLAADGVTRFVEAGPGSALTRMVRWVERSAEASPAEELTLGGVTRGG